MIDGKIFQRLGLPKHSHEVYTLLQKYDHLLPAHIASKLKTHRPTIYRALAALTENRFISSEQIGARTYYMAMSESRITEAFASVAETTKESALNETHEDTLKLAHMRILTGSAGVRMAFDDVVTHTPRGETFYRYTSEKDLARADSYLSRTYRNVRDSKKLERLVISNPRSGKQKRPRLERFIKYIPEEFDHFDQDIIQITYGKRIALIDLNVEQAIIVENASLADFQKVIFKMLYRKLS